MPKKLRIRYHDEFLAMMDEVPSNSTVELIGKTIGRLQVFPDSGSGQVRPSVRDRYGDDIRTVAVDGYLLVYRHNAEVLELIALVWGALVK